MVPPSMSRTRVRAHRRRGRPVRESVRTIQRTGYPTKRRLTRREQALLDEWGEPWGYTGGA